MSYAIGDAVEVKRGGRWVPGEVTEVDLTPVYSRDPVYRVEVDGHRKWYPASDRGLRPARAARMPTVRATEPDTEEAESFEAARQRSVGTVRAPLVEQPKARPVRSGSFLAFVRQHPCCCCGAPRDIEAHHIVNGGVGKKASDRLTAPLTAEHHAFWHQHGHLPGRDRIGSLACMWEASARIQDAYEERGRAA